MGIEAEARIVSVTRIDLASGVTALGGAEELPSRSARDKVKHRAILSASRWDAEESLPLLIGQQLSVRHLGGDPSIRAAADQTAGVIEQGTTRCRA
jgi:hypothetical protein